MMKVCSQKGRAKTTQMNPRIKRINKKLNAPFATKGDTSNKNVLSKEKAKSKEAKRKTTRRTKGRSKINCRLNFVCIFRCLHNVRKFN